MTRERFYGSDTEFCAWMRSCADLPSYSQDFGFVASDNDITVHRYLTSVDGIGTREVQGIMQVEVKTRTGKPSLSQMDTISKLNLFSGTKKSNGVHVTFFGVFLLIMDGTDPDNSENIWWGCIPRKQTLSDAKNLKWHIINRTKLIQLLRFDIHPQSLTTKTFRRHHKTNEVIETAMSELGFEYEKRIITRS